MQFATQQKRTLKWMLIVAQFIALPAVAAIPHRYERLDLCPTYFDFSKGLNYGHIQRVSSLRIIRSEDIEKMIPTNMQASDDTGHVASQILDQSFQSLLSSNEFRSSDLGKQASRTEKRLNSEIVLGQADSGVQHKLRFQMKPFQTKAVVGYSGYVDANLSYQALQQKTDLEVLRPLDKSTSLVYNHTLQTSEQRDTLSLRWSF